MDGQLSPTERQLLLLTRQFLLEQEAERAIRLLSLETSLEQQLGIDSLQKVELFHRIEKVFGVRFSDAVVAKTDTLRAVSQAILDAKPAKKISRRAFAPILERLDTDVSKVATLTDALIEYALHEPDRPHVYLPDEEGNERTITYGQLLAKASSVANSLIAQGIQPDDTVAIMLPTSSDFFYSFMGVLLAGAIPVPIYPPFRQDRIEEYAIREAKILNNAEVRLLITFAEAQMLSKLLQTDVPSLKVVTTASRLLTGKSALPGIPRTGEQAALIQYTSGSTGDPKGVLLLHKNILANIKAIAEAIHLQPTDVAVSWLPLYHDMGLMSWIGSLYYGIPITVLSPLTFIHRPERWLWAIHYHRATLSAGPNFAYELCVKKIEDAAVEGLDLRSWRIAFNGAEAVNPQTLRRFYDRFKGYGFKKEALFPVYGLAENTVALAFPEPGHPPRIDQIDREPFEKKLSAMPLSGKNALEFVSEGKAIPGHAIRIVDEHDQVLEARRVGKIQFRGPSAMPGYYRNPQATEAAYCEGWWDTGDLGYKVGEALFVTGRRKDLIIKAGRNLYPETIEEVVGNLSGIRKGCVVAFGVSDPKRGTESIVVVAETKLLDVKDQEGQRFPAKESESCRTFSFEARLDKKVSEQRSVYSYMSRGANFLCSRLSKNERLSVKREGLQERLRDAVVEQVSVTLGVPPDRVIIAPPHTIPKTSSGKLQRSACKAAYLAGELMGTQKAAYRQITRLFLNALRRHVLQFFNRLLRFVYTIYAWAVLFVAVIPFWLLVLILPPKHVASLIKYWTQGFFKLIFCPINVINENNLYHDHPLIYCTNHASYADSLILLAVLPPGTLFIGKKELLNVPIIASVMKKLNFITIDRLAFSKNIEDTQRIRHALELEHSILMFPEGTFTYASGLRPFKTGAFQLAADTQSSICPIALQNTRRLLRDGSFLLRPSRITVTVCDLMQPKGQDWEEVVRLRTETRKIIAQHCGEPTIDLYNAQDG